MLLILLLVSTATASKLVKSECQLRLFFLRVFVLLYVFVFVGSILSRSPSTLSVYIVNICFEHLFSLYYKLALCFQKGLNATLTYIGLNSKVNQGVIIQLRMTILIILK